MKTKTGALFFSALMAGACVPDPSPEGGAQPATGETTPVIDGRYDQQPASCGDQNSLTQLTVQGDNFRFYESECTFGRKGGQPSAAEGTLICMGEGQRFTRDIQLQATADTLTIVENDTAKRYSRCPT